VRGVGATASVVVVFESRRRGWRVAVADDLPRLAFGFEHTADADTIVIDDFRAVLQERLGPYAVDRGYEISSDLTLESCWMLSLGFSPAAPIRAITVLANRTRLKPTPAACSALL
jgi:hypothetical protein